MSAAPEGLYRLASGSWIRLRDVRSVFVDAGMEDAFAMIETGERNYHSCRFDTYQQAQDYVDLIARLINGEPEDYAERAAEAAAIAKEQALDDADRAAEARAGLAVFGDTPLPAEFTAAAARILGTNDFAEPPDDTAGRPSPGDFA